MSIWQGMLNELERDRAAVAAAPVAEKIKRIKVGDYVELAKDWSMMPAKYTKAGTYKVVSVGKNPDGFSLGNDAFCCVYVPSEHDWFCVRENAILDVLGEPWPG